ncbi:hypothetical protein H0O03_04770 [Candidatus Micrarchaeota archaeon]|nr:hypothetical protein [Candidatus Micrarchaeota archaeon]
MGKETQILGKQGEFFVFQKLLERELPVYAPLFDIEGIDCIIRTPRGQHIDIQVKTREKDALFDISGRFEPRDDFFIVCFLAGEETAWVLPSKVFYKYCIKTSVKGKPLHRLIVGKEKRKELAQYTNDLGFDSLVEYSGVGKTKVGKSGWERLKEKYLREGAPKIRVSKKYSKGTQYVYRRIQKLQKKMKVV